MIWVQFIVSLAFASPTYIKFVLWEILTLLEFTPPVHQPTAFRGSQKETLSKETFLSTLLLCKEKFINGGGPIPR